MANNTIYVQLMLLFSLISLFAVPLVQASCHANFCGFGEREDFPNGFICHCAPGYKGSTCNEILYPNEDPCLQRPCWNNGTCLILNGAQICVCRAEFSGPTCRGIRPAECTATTCQNNGICQVVGGISTLCTCVNDFTGKNCETKLPLCQQAKNPCLNGAICFNNTCICPPNFSGQFCGVQADPPSLLKGEVIIKNKGGYVASATLSYVFNGQTRTLKVNNLGIKSRTIEYDRPAFNVSLTVNAAAYSKPIFSEFIKKTPTCYDLYGTLPFPKYTAVTC